MRQRVVSILIAAAITMPGYAEDLNESLWRLAELGFEQTCDCILERGADPNACPPTNDSPLGIAAHHGSTGVVRVLLRRNAIAGVANRHGLTPLHLAAAGGHSEVVDELLSRPIRIDVPDNDENTPLHLAVQNGHAMVVDLLLDAGAAPDLVDGKGVPPLAATASLNYPRVIDSLSRAGANPDVVSKCVGGVEPDAGEWEHTFETPTSELRAETHSVPIICDGTPVFYAVRDGSSDAAVRLLELGAATEATNARGDTPIFFALQQDRLEFLPLLGRYGANANAFDRSGRTPLIAAVHKGSVAAVSAVAAIGADLDRVDRHGTRPIHAAAGRRGVDVLKRLIDLGADVRSPDGHGDTALHVAAANNRSEGARLLLAASADANARGAGGATPLMIAAARHGVDAVQVLLSASADVHARDDRGRGILWYAVLGEDADIVAQLLRHGAPASEPDQFGVTPWQLAVWNRCGEILALLPAQESQPTIPWADYLPIWIGDVPLLAPPPVPPRQPTEIRTDDLNFDRTKIDYSKLPSFPWPPPRASAFTEIPARLLAHRKGATFGDVAAHIVDALKHLGYTEPTYYQVQRKGFAIVAPIENFYPDGRIKPPDQRWLIKPGGKPPSDPLEYVLQLFGKPRGQYRMLVFIITTEVLRPFAGKEITLTDARTIFDEGAASIAPIAAAPFTAAHTCYALVYEFEQNGYSPATFVPKSGLSGARHLTESRIMEKLTR